MIHLRTDHQQQAKKTAMAAITIAALLWNPTPARCLEGAAVPIGPIATVGESLVDASNRAADGTADRTRTAPTGWWWSGSEWYLIHEDGTVQTGWYEEDSIRYHFSDSGVMDRGWTSIDSARYYFDPSGRMQRTWIKLQDDWYYLGLDGALRTGWFTDGGQTKYHADAAGKMLTGWHWIGSEWYYFNDDGSMATGWRWLDGAWYLLSRDGDMARGIAFDGSGWSRFDDSGRWSGYCAAGWLQVESDWYLIDNQGVPARRWRFVSNAWYYCAPSTGIMQTGWADIDGLYYYLAPSGAMLSNAWKKDDEGRLHYARSSGEMASGWQQIEDETYYFDPAVPYHPLISGRFTVGGNEYATTAGGALITAAWVPEEDGTARLADKNGVLRDLVKRSGRMYRAGSQDALTGFIEVGDGSKLYADPATGRQMTGWHLISGRWYYFDSRTGFMVTGWIFTDSRWYYCAPAGEMLEGWQYLDGCWYFLDPAKGGAMATGETKVGQQWYYLDATSGAMATGWKFVATASKWSYYDPAWGGARRNESGIVGDRYCAFDSSGRLLADTSWRAERVAREAARCDAYGMKVGWCQAWISKAYERAGESNDSRACAWEAARSWIVSTNRGGIPVGATVYQRSPSGSHGWSGGVYYPDFGHVGIYIGNGKVSSLRTKGVVVDPVEVWTEGDGWLGWGWNGGIPLV